MIGWQPANGNKEAACSKDEKMAHFKTWTCEIGTDKRKKEERPLRVMLMADLHDRLWGEGQRTLLEAVDVWSPDLVLCAGDMVLSRGGAQSGHTLLLFEGLAKRRIPVVAGNGNHETRMREKEAEGRGQYREYVRRLSELGVQVPVNETVSWRCGSMSLQIHGYEMSLEYYKKFRRLPRYDGADLTKIFGKPKEDVFHILLAHNPVYFPRYAAWGADLTLSGHLHGGLIRLPGIGGVITPQAKLFPRYDRGLYERDGKYMVVSPGLGEHTIPIRIGNPPWLIGIKIQGTGE